MAKVSDLHQVELTPANIDEVAFGSGRSREDLQNLLDRRRGKESIQVWVFVKEETDDENY